jgi:hypothetical protein
VFAEFAGGRRSDPEYPAAIVATQSPLRQDYIIVIWQKKLVSEALFDIRLAGVAPAAFRHEQIS